MMSHKLNRVFLLAAVVVLAATAAQADVTMNLVPVGDTGNAADNTGYGTVDYAYQIDAYEVTAGQYCTFLNAVAVTDTYGLYGGTGMASESSLGCMIQRSGPSGSYAYTVDAEYADRPVNYVSWGDAARYVNWLSNGQPTTGAQDATTTEDGSYGRASGFTLTWR